MHVGNRGPRCSETVADCWLLWTTGGRGSLQGVMPQAPTASAGAPMVAARQPSWQWEEPPRPLLVTTPTAPP